MASYLVIQVMGQKSGIGYDLEGTPGNSNNEKME